MILDVIGFGALNMDRIYRVNRLAGADEESYIKDVAESCGGSAANTIIGLSRLGMKTGFLGKVAMDREGKILRNNLGKEGVDTRALIISPEGRSGTVHGFVDGEGERALYVDPGVNEQVKLQEIDYAYTANCNLLHLSSFVGGSIKAQEAVLDRIPDDIAVSMDPGMLYAHKGLKSLHKLLTGTDILLLNQQEVEVLLPGLEFEEQVEALLDYDIKILAIKNGSEGCFVSDGDEYHQIYAFEVSCKDTTGAGDAFNAGFIYGILKGYDIKDAGVLGNYVASCSIQKYGACSGLPYQEDIPLFQRPEEAP
ncbi:MAG: carbohydrate kinase family protein [Methanobacteriaceae archaeon]|nr:carbohydrate kinase family protein [Methanobacteriaceae archaeon]